MYTVKFLVYNFHLGKPLETHFCWNQCLKCKFAIADDNTTCEALGPLVTEASAYLFPFVLEYSLVVVGILFGYLINVNREVTDDIIKRVTQAIRKKNREGEQQQEKKGPTNAFQKSHAGLFLGALTLTSVVIVTVLLFILKGKDQENETTLIYYIYDIISYAVLLTAGIVLFVKIRNFAVSKVDVNTIDDVLLLLSVSAVFLLKFFKFFSDIEYFVNGSTDIDPALDIVCCILTIGAALWQTVLIINSLHLHCKTETHFAEKPGRGVIAFLVIFNIGAWLFNSINIKQLARPVHEATYGNIAWPLIFYGFVPLMLFYHFHSSVMWADIWEHAYKRSEWLE